MMGSGTVIRHATDLRLHAVGFDMDPLAVLMSRVWTTPVDDEAIERVYTKALKIALAAIRTRCRFPGSTTTPRRAHSSNMVRRRQSDALRCWSAAISLLDEEVCGPETAALDVLRIALSRIIVTKEQCASLARDTSHSRPHRVTLTPTTASTRASVDR